MNPTQEYGYVLIPPEKHAQFVPLRTTDECWSPTFLFWDRTNNSPAQSFSDGLTYRRKIDPGQGWEIIPAVEIVPERCEGTCDGEHWIPATWGNPRPLISDAFKVCQEPGNNGVLAFRRRTQPKSEWLDVKEVTPKSGDRIWINHAELGVLLNTFRGEKPKMWTHWRSVKPGEIPEPPKIEPVKSLAELDQEALESWYRSRSDSEDELCERALRQAYIAGLRDGRAK